MRNLEVAQVHPEGRELALLQLSEAELNKSQIILALIQAQLDW